MEDEQLDIQFDIISRNPFMENSELRLSKERIDFLLPRKKRGRSYTVLFQVYWDEIISFDCSPVMYCKDELTWPLNEPLPKKYKEIGKAGIFFLFLRAQREAYFQIWSIIPFEDVDRIAEYASQVLGRENVPGLAHHGTTGVVNYVLDNCEVKDRIRLRWHDWIKSGPSTKPREKFLEIDPELVICREGVAFNFKGASSQLKQMSTFWPWRVIREITQMSNEVPQIAYIWHEDSYTFTQQVWDESERNTILSKLQDAFQAYKVDESVREFKLIRPWSFPSRFYDTWDNLQPFASKASREGFPPIEIEE